MPTNNFCKISDQDTECKTKLIKVRALKKIVPGRKYAYRPKVIIEIKRKDIFSTFNPEINIPLNSTSITPKKEDSSCIPQVNHVTEECTSISSDEKVMSMTNRKRPRADILGTKQLKKNKKEKHLHKVKAINKNKNKNAVNKDDIDQIHSSISDNTVKGYQDTEYYNDLLTILNDSKHRFMYRNFPSSYDKCDFYKHIKLKNLKKKNAHLKFKDKEQVKSNEGKEEQEQKETTQAQELLIPMCKWRPSKEGNLTDTEYQHFITRMKEIWLVDLCEMRIDFLLEYLMINEYKTEKCFETIDECMMFVLQKCQNITINSEDNNSSNKYALRKKMNYEQTN